MLSLNWQCNRRKKVFSLSPFIESSESGELSLSIDNTCCLWLSHLPHLSCLFSCLFVLNKLFFRILNFFSASSVDRFFFFFFLLVWFSTIAIYSTIVIDNRFKLHLTKLCHCSTTAHTFHTYFFCNLSSFASFRSSHQYFHLSYYPK